MWVDKTAQQGIERTNRQPSSNWLEESQASSLKGEMGSEEENWPAHDITVEAGQGAQKAQESWYTGLKQQSL